MTDPGATTFTANEMAPLNARLDQASPHEIVEWAAGAFEGRLAMTSSFGADSLCTIHLATQVVPHIPIIFVNTGYLFPETLKFMEEMRERFQLNVHEFHTHNDPVVWLSLNGEPDPRVHQRPAHARRQQGSRHGPRHAATRPRRVPPRRPRRPNCGACRHAGCGMDEALQLLGHLPHPPLVHQASLRVHAKTDLPHHPLWELGYTSIGCNPETCTRPVGFGEDERAGRWSGSDKKECGINLDLGKDI